MSEVLEEISPSYREDGVEILVSKLLTQSADALPAVIGEDASNRVV